MSNAQMLTANFNVAEVRNNFPILKKIINNYPIAYLDNAATTQKPQAVIDAITQYYMEANANVHRAVHALSLGATLHFEEAREKIMRFINAKAACECIFVRGTTEAINMVAHSFVAPRILPGEEILITYMEHHSNIVPWQMICKKTGALLKAAPINFAGEIILEDFANLLTDNTKFVAISHVSNALGTINPVRQMIKMAHEHGSLVLLDGAQAIPHLPIDVQNLDCDFYAFSGHKLYGPTGIGILWGKEKLLDDMLPYQGGGEMIKQVTMAATEYAPLPYKLEAGTPDIAGVIGLGAAIDYLWTLDLDAIKTYEDYLLNYTTDAVRSVHGFNIVGTAKSKVPIISFVHGKIHAHDIGTVLDNAGIAIRSGHHCAMPLMDFLEVPATSRIALSFYNTVEEIDRCVQTLHKVKEIFK